MNYQKDNKQKDSNLESFYFLNKFDLKMFLFIMLSYSTF